MRYPLNAHRKELAATEGAQEHEKELAKEIPEGDLDDEDIGGDFREAFSEPRGLPCIANF